MPAIKKSQVKLSFYVYQLKDGSFFTRGQRGSFSTAAKPYTRKELTVRQIALAEHFKEVGVLEVLNNTPPYNETFMYGGRWVKCEAVTNYSYRGV